MDSSGVREHPQRSPPGPRAGNMGESSRDEAEDLFGVLEKRREEDELEEKMGERRQMIELIKQKTNELQKQFEEVKQTNSNLKKFVKGADAGPAVQRAERQSEERRQRQAERQRLEEEVARLAERKRRLRQEVHARTVYRDFMARVAKLTKFEGAEQLSGHLESLLHFRSQLYQRESEAQERADQQRRALLTLEDRHRLLRLLRINQLSLLQTELEKTRAETLTWERKWNRIQETAAKKTLLLGQIKMATFNLYEMTVEGVEGEESVDMNDTEKQLEKAKVFIQDHEDIVKQHQAPAQRQSDAQKRGKAKKQTTVYW